MKNHIQADELERRLIEFAGRIYPLLIRSSEDTNWPSYLLANPSLWHCERSKLC
jgi:hypothetical protein